MRLIPRAAALGLVLTAVLECQTLVRLKTGIIDTHGSRAEVRSLEIRSERERRHWLLQFRSYPGPPMQAELERRGIRALEYVPDFALVVSSTGLPDLSNLDVTWAGTLGPRQKISPLIASGRYDGFIVSFHLDARMERAADLIRGAGFEVVENAGMLPRHILIEGPPGRLGTLAADDDVAYIFPADWELRLRRPRYRCPGPLTEAGPVADYALASPGWPKDASGNVALGYFFDTLTAKLDANSVESEIERAFTEWERYANVTFTPAARQSAARSVDILFATGAHGDDYPFTSLTMLAHTFYPAPPNAETIAGDMHFNDDEDWQVGQDVDLFSVALHEAGHALGLAHSDDPSAVMYPYYKISSGLSTDDVAAIQALYGSRGSSSAPPTPTPTPTPSPTQNPTPTPAPPAPTNPASPGKDATPPSLTIVSPAGTIVSAYTSSIVITGIASDNVGVSDVEWSNSNGGSGKASGTDNWTATVPLLVGDNAITLKAYDAAGNSAWRAITVVRH